MWAVQYNGLGLFRGKDFHSFYIVFSEKEVDYVKSQRLARIVTANRTGDPDVAPVGFDFEGEYFYVSGHILTRTHKFRNIFENPKVSFVIDDLRSLKPWAPECSRYAEPQTS